MNIPIKVLTLMIAYSRFCSVLADHAKAQKSMIRTQENQSLKSLFFQGKKIKNLVA
jgi:hypothetical protein